MFEQEDPRRAKQQEFGLKTMGPQEKQALWFSRATRFGATVAVVSVLSIGFTAVIKVFPVSEPYFTYGVGVVVVAGLLTLVIDIERYRRKATPEEILAFHRNPHFWGCVVLLTGAVVFAVCKPAPLVVRARTIPRAPTNAAPRAVEFPDLQVTAVVVNGERSAATLNGSVVLLNECVQGVKLVGVSETNVVVELSGVRKDVPWVH